MARNSLTHNEGEMFDILGKDNDMYVWLSYLICFGFQTFCDGRDYKDMHRVAVPIGMWKGRNTYNLCSLIIV